MIREFYSIGIDIGTTTTHLVISRLKAQIQQQAGPGGKNKITGREIVYQSPVYFTPMSDSERMDADKLAEMVREELGSSRIPPEEIRTGAVIITGESAKKENAGKVAELISRIPGEFVVGTAGADLEGLLAGYGAGAALFSSKVEGRLVNIDIGGGTSNAAIFEKGGAIETYTCELGGRCLRLDKAGRITHIQEKIRPALELRGRTFQVGDRLRAGQLFALGEKLAGVFLEMAGYKAVSGFTRSLLVQHGNRGLKVDRVMFSGGVSEFVYGCTRREAIRAARIFGDLGPVLGCCIGECFRSNGIELLKPQQKIRATVIGAGAYSVTLSGSTFYCTGDVLPLKNIPIFRLFTRDGDENPGYIRHRLAEAQRIFEGNTYAIAFKGTKSPSYQMLRKLSGEIHAGLKKGGQQAVVILESDFAKALGQALDMEFEGSRPVICLDGISVDTGDYIDIGKNLHGVVPVVVKTLIFNCGAGGEHGA